MIRSIWDNEVLSLLDTVQSAGEKTVLVDGLPVRIPQPFPSPPDWRDQCMYFIMVDRFNNPDQPPRQLPYNALVDDFQGGTFEGIRQQLDYLKELGVGAIWMTPILKNCQYSNTYYGYAIQDFLQIDPRFASDPDNAEEELQRLIDEAHARGIYIIFDIVLNHTGDVFEYILENGSRLSKAAFSDNPYTINWRKSDGSGNLAWTEAPADGDPDLQADAVVWPKELRKNKYFRRQGAGGEEAGDFESLKELVTHEEEVRTALIRIHQYLIARYDVDGFRIDTLKYIEPDFARIFGNAMREFALSIGKTNFFTFGEVYDNEEKIAHFIGRRAMEQGDITGVDAALDFPLFYKLPAMVKNIPDNNHPVTPAQVAQVFEHRKEVQRGIISSHSEASQYFVTFLDNHDQKHRLYHQDATDPHKYDNQVTMAIACLYALQGIPCLYYGTEQGLSGSGNSDQAIRESLWAKPDGFDRTHAFYQAIRAIYQVRTQQPTLRYGRQYFRPLSGDGQTFGFSHFSPGILAFSRILHNQEVVVVANTHTTQSESVYILIDFSLHRNGSSFQVLYSNQTNPNEPDGVEERPSQIRIANLNGNIHSGPARVVRVHLKPMEVQILAK